MHMAVPNTCAFELWSTHMALMDEWVAAMKYRRLHGSTSTPQLTSV